MATKTDNANMDEVRGGTSSESSRSRAGEAYRTARERTASAYEAARGRAAEVTKSATEQVSVYPVGAVLGGLALGALIGFLVPRTEREERLFGSTGRKLTGAAKDAAQRGLDAGKEQIEQIRSKATQKVGEAVVEAVTGNGSGSDTTSSSSTNN